MPSGGLNFVIALAGCMTFFGCLLAGSVVLGRHDPASIPRYLRWLAAERPEVVLEQDLAWTDSRGVKRRGGKDLVVPEIYEVEIRERVERSSVAYGSSRSWEEQGWMPIAARLAPLTHSSNSSSYPPAKSSTTEKPSGPLLPSTSITSPRDASPPPRPTLLVAFLISPPLPPRSTNITLSQGEAPVIDFDFEIGVEQVRLEGKVEELKSKSTWT